MSGLSAAGKSYAVPQVERLPGQMHLHATAQESRKRRGAGRQFFREFEEVDFAASLDRGVAALS